MLARGVAQARRIAAEGAPAADLLAASK